MWKLIGFALLMVVVAGAAMVRVRPLDPAQFHVPPASLAATGVDDRFVVSPAGNLDTQRYDMPVSEVIAKLEAVIAATPRTTRLAGSLEEGMATYVTRTAIMAFPDITTIQLEEVDGGTELQAAAKQVYGIKDFGTNETRLRGWLAALED